MNNFFSLRRFLRLFVKHTAEHYRTYLMSVAVLAGVMLLGGWFLFFVVLDAPDAGLQTAIFVILMLIAGTIFTSTVFSDFGDKAKAVNALTLPATSFEKFLVGWVYSYPIFLVVYTAVFYVVLWGLGAIRHWGPSQHFNGMDLRRDGLYLMFIIFSVLHAITLFGAIFFEKLQFIKTGFAFFIAYAVAMTVNTLLLKLLTGLETIKPAMPFGYLNFDEGRRYYSIAVVNGASGVVVIIMVLSTLAIWAAAYYRLK